MLAEIDAELAERLLLCGIMHMLPALLGTPWRSVQLATLWLCRNLQRQCALSFMGLHRHTVVTRRTLL